jgi:hypothetical protein
MNIQPNHPASSISGSLRTGAKDGSDSTETNATQQSRSDISAKRKEAKPTISEGGHAGHRDADGRQVNHQSKRAASDVNEVDPDRPTDDAQPDDIQASASPPDETDQRLDFRV